MTPDQLLAHFDRIAEAPDAVGRLRRFILDLAVRGKLVSQDPADEPALELLKKIAAEKARLVKAGEIRKDKPRPSIDPSKMLFDLPSGWSWVRLGEVIHLVSGQHLQPPEYTNRVNGGVPYVTGPSDFGSDGLIISRFALVRKAVARAGQLLLTVKGSGVGKATLCNLPEVAISRQLMAMTAILWSGDYLRLVTHLLSETLKENARSLIPGISRDNVCDFVAALPPLAEQRRIVAKVDELMALCDRLEVARNGREAGRDRLVAASLHRLNQPDPDAAAFAGHADFALRNLAALTTRPEHVQQLRQTILNLAVRGRLVPQDPNDEPASALLKRIADEKNQLLKAGGTKKQRPLPPLSEDDESFQLPNGWSWVRLGNLCQFVTSGSRDWAKHYSNEGAIFVRMGNLSKGHYHLRLDNIQRVKPPAGGEGTRTRLEAGDILISITGEVGMLGLIPEGFGEAYINQHTAMVRPMPEMKSRFLPELFRSSFAQVQFNEPQRGIKNSFRLTDVTHFVVPLPPLVEQQRIVAKVDELMALCDRLEESLKAQADTSHRLLESILHHALAPAHEEAA